MDNDIMAGARREANISPEELLGESGEQSQEEKETPSESPTEQNQVEDSPSQEGEEAKESSEEESKDESEEQPKAEDTPDDTKLPFHKHPRWKQMYEDNKHLRELVETLSSTTHEVRDEIKGLKSNQSPSIPPELQTLLGDNPEAYKAWRSAMDNERQQIIADWQKQQQEAQAKAQQEESTRVEAIAQAVSEVEEQFNVQIPRGSSDYNAFLLFMEKRMPMNADGSLNFIGGWEWFQETKTAKSSPKKDEKKQVASKTVSTPTGEPEEKSVFTLDDFPGFGR